MPAFEDPIGPFEDVVGPGTFDYWADLGQRIGERQVAERRARDPNFAFNREALGGRESPEGIDRVIEPPTLPPPPTYRPPVGGTPPTPPGPPAPPTPGLQLPGFPAPQDLMRQIMSMILMEQLRKFFGGGLPAPSQFIPGGLDLIRPLPVHGAMPGPDMARTLPVYGAMPFQPRIPTPGEVTQGPIGLPWGPMGAGNAMWSWLSQFFMQPRPGGLTDLLGQPKSPDKAYAWV